MITHEYPHIEVLSRGLPIGQHKKKCPYCQGDRRRHKSDRPLSIKVDHEGVQFRCWHCNREGGWTMNSRTSSMWDFDTSVPTNGSNGAAPKRHDASTQQGIDGEEYLVRRGINKELIKKHVVSSQYRFNGVSQSAVGFPYRATEPTAIKWRSTDSKKLFSQQNVCRDFYLLETYKTGNDILICEGEVDALAWKSAGLPDNISVFSVPNGAPSRVSQGKVDPHDDRRFEYVWRAKEALASANRVYLNTDNDGPGKALAEELSRRLGRARSWVTTLGDHKDAAEALQKEGADFLLSRFAASEPLPMTGLHNAEEFADSVVDLYEHGKMRGALTGIDSVDSLVSIPLGMMTIMTGFPGSGKSDLIDQMCVNLAQNYGWKTVFCSFEKPVDYHIALLAQKKTGKAFFEPEAPNCSIERMTPTERDHAQEWVRDNFMFMDPSKGGPSDIRGILDFASAAVMRMGCRVLVIDPYNYVDIDRSSMETNAISDMLTAVRQWAQQHDAHVFFVAHPSKPDVRVGKYVCTGLDVSQSMNWFNKADIGMTAWRSSGNENELHVWKVRWSWMGKLGFARLHHTPENSRWMDARDYVDNYDWDF